MKKILCIIIALILNIAVCVEAYADDGHIYMEAVPTDGGYFVRLYIENVTASVGSFEIAFNNEKFALSNLKASDVLSEAMVAVNESFGKGRAKVSFISLEPVFLNGETVTFEMNSMVSNASDKVTVENIIVADADENPVSVIAENLTLGKSKPSGSGNHSGSRPGTSPNGQTARIPADSKETTPAPSFNDISDFDWAKEQILFLASKGIINGTGGGSFSPGDHIKRGDFVCMLMRMISPSPAQSAPFDDVVPGEYWYNDIMTARAIGIANGYENKFSPSSLVTRQDMFVLVTRAFGIDSSDGGASYEDSGFVAEYAQNAVNTLSYYGIIHGNNGRINPLSNATRAEAAVMLYNIYNYIYGGNQ